MVATEKLKYCLRLLWALLVTGYLGFAVFAVIEVAHYDRAQIAIFRPSPAQFQNAVRLSGRLQWDTRHKGGAVPYLGGQELACEVTFMGVSDICAGVLRHLGDGTSLTADVVLIPTWIGPRWVARSIGLGDDLVYARAPEQMMQNWDTASQAEMLQHTYFLLAVLIGVPLLIPLLIKIASWLPQTGSSDETAKKRKTPTRVIDGTKPWG